MARRTPLTLLAVLAFAVVAMFGSVPPAYAATTIPIRTGNTGAPIGTASFTRTLAGDGTESVAMTLDVTGSGRTIEEVHVCVDGAAFTGRIPPGRCRFGFPDLSGTVFTHTLDLGTEFIGRTVCLQPHLEVIGSDGNTSDTGYAGWTAGKPFFGTLCFDAPGTDVPVGAVGIVGLTVAVTGGLLTTTLSRRRVR